MFCRELFRLVTQYDGEALFEEVLEPWLMSDVAELCRDGLARIAVEAEPLRYTDESDSFELYAFSRVIDLLISAFETRSPADPNDAWHLRLTLEQFESFMATLGLERIPSQTVWHPFFHEIVDVVADRSPDAAPIVLDELWPGFRKGALLICRAGTRLRAGSNHIVKEVGESSVLNWAYHRRGRVAVDRSAGWGSNSQWATEFRFDFQIDGTFYYNAASTHLDGDELAEMADYTDDYTDDELSEFIRNRCFVRRVANHHEPYCPPDLMMLIERPGKPMEFRVRPSESRVQGSDALNRRIEVQHPPQWKLKKWWQFWR